MGTLNDEILRATGGPTVQDGLRFYYLENGAVTGNIEDLERQFLATQVTPTGKTNQDMWMEYLGTGLGLLGTLNDKLLQYWGAISTPVFANLLLNSSWQGIAGSVGGADFVPPTSWTIDANFTTSEAIAVPDSGGVGENGCQFQSLATERGYFVQAAIAGTNIGDILQFSIFVDECITAPTGIFVRMLNGVTLRSQNNPIYPGFVGRVNSVYEVVGATVNTRCCITDVQAGAADVTFSRPMVNIGSILRPYVST